MYNVHFSNDVVNYTFVFKMSKIDFVLQNSHIFMFMTSSTIKKIERNKMFFANFNVKKNYWQVNRLVKKSLFLKTKIKFFLTTQQKWIQSYRCEKIKVFLCMTINWFRTLSSLFWSYQHSLQSIQQIISFWFNRFNRDLNRKSSSLSMSKKFIFLKITTMMMITTTINRPFMIATTINRSFNNILSHSSKHSLSSINQTSRISRSTHLLFQSILIILLSQATMLFQSISIILFQSQHLMTSTTMLFRSTLIILTSTTRLYQSISIILQSISRSIFSKTLLKNCRFFFQKSYTLSLTMNRTITTHVMLITLLWKKNLTDKT